MARSKQEVISEMVDSGLFSDDEIRSAVKKAPQPQQIAPWKQALSKTAQMGLPVLGAAGGAALASPATFTGAPVVGGAAGFALGQGLANRLDEAMGMSKPKNLKESFGETGKDLQYGAMGELLPLMLLRGGGAAANAIKRNPSAVGSAVDAMGGLPTGSGRVAIENPEVTKPGFYSFDKVKDFAGRLSEDLARFEGKAKSGWVGARESIDRSFGGAGKAERQALAQAIAEAKDAAGVKSPPLLMQKGMQPLNEAVDPFNVGRQGMDIDPMGVPVERPRIPSRTTLESIQGPQRLSGREDPFSSELVPIKKYNPAIPGVTGVGNEVVTGLDPLNPTNFPARPGGKVISRQLPQPGSTPSNVSFGDAPSGELEGEAIRGIESKLNSFVQDAPYGGQQAKSKLNLNDLTELRKRADYYINWDKNGGPALSREGQGILKQLRGKIDSMISNTPEYASFKTSADEPFQEAMNVADQAKSTFGIGKKPFQEMSTTEQKGTENAIKNTLKKGGAERAAISNLEDKLGGGYLNEAEMLAAAGGPTPERRLPFERALRPGMGYALLGGAGAAGASALFNPMAALSSLAGLGIAATATSPRAIGAAIRNAPRIAGAVKPIPPVLARIIAAALAKRKETSNAQR